MTYRTIQGDMWDLISYKITGSVAGMTQLLQANPNYVEYVVFPAGIVLVVPDFTDSVSETLPPWLIGGESV